MKAYHMQIDYMTGAYYTPDPDCVYVVIAQSLKQAKAIACYTYITAMEPKTRIRARLLRKYPIELGQVI